jgi:hypothetical protein
VTGAELAIAAAPIIAGAIIMVCLVGPIWRRREGHGGIINA